VNDTLVILNPAAHSDRAARAHDRIEALARGCRVCTTTGPGDAEIIARHAASEGFRKIVAAGGDGTTNEVVNGLAGSDAMLGVLPVGTVNVFALELGLPSDLEQCWQIINADHTRLVDLAQANGKHFVQLAGVGLDAQVVKETSAALKRNFGPLSYLISAAQVASRTPPRLTVEADGQPEEIDGSLVLVGNGRRYGGPFPFFKQAVIDDGLLDVIVFHQLGYFEIIRYLQEVFFSSEIRLPEIDYFQTKRLRVTSQEEVPVELDGELVGDCPVEFTLQQRSLRVLAPI
jgi:YegS/Rv2252/BmrU family lipid kinase